jgi:hypothetical protein
VTLPEHDVPTVYLSAWCKKPISVAEEHGFTPLLLEGDKACLKNFESYIKNNPVLVIFNGHGNSTTITGHNSEPIITLGKNEILLKDRIVYSISCASASELGAASVNKGTIGFIGYNDDFIFLHDANTETRPLQDALAKVFLEHSNVFIISLVKGNSISESYEHAKKQLQKHLSSYLTVENYDQQIVRYLWWNLHNFAFYGNPEAKL